MLSRMEEGRLTKRTTELYPLGLKRRSSRPLVKCTDDVDNLQPFFDIVQCRTGSRESRRRESMPLDVPSFQ